MNEKKAIFIINILKNIIEVYFDTFFVFYFFKVSNYEVIPLAKYYITLYFFIGLGFILIKKQMKKNFKVPYFRIGISLQAIYIALIMLLKENIINYIYLVAFIKGIADGFYHYPKNIMNTEKITNNDRQKFDGIVNIINKIVSIIIPIILGVALTFMSYTSLGKVFFILFIIMYIVSFYLKDLPQVKECNNQKFTTVIKSNKKIKYALMQPLLSGLTYSSGVMGIIITLSKIYNFKTNLNLGFVDSILAAISLIVCILFTSKITPQKFNKTLIISGSASFISLILFSFSPTKTNLIIYLFIRNSFIKIIELISSNIVTNFSNSENLDKSFKVEFYCAKDILYSISRCIGYLILLFVCLKFGINYINYIMIIPAVAILAESIIMNRLNKKYN